ncbi:MAG TPA: FAD-dependent thymidylate synthase, partial [Actinomycetes bacterium]|nr:FAD-dependent thymidylate synthase [Actinomycetes bacterium]
QAPAYWVEELTDDERARLAPYVTNLDRPVFALRNLPETVKGALFARYSRSGKTLRRLFLDEFADQVEAGEPTGTAEIGVARATALYQRVFDEYGDDSVAQLGGAHVACEQASNLLTKQLEWGRLAAYLEQSTRYVSYADRPGGRWRYHLDPDVEASDLGPEYRRVMDGLFTTYAELLPALTGHLSRVVPHEPGSSEAAWRRAVKARALDGLRGLLPAATTSNLGIFATGQAYEALLLRLRASALPEARSYANLLLEELRQVIPAFLHRVDREDRGVAWSRYLAETAAETAKVVEAVLGDAAPAAQPGPSVTLTEFDPAAEDKVLTAIAYPNLGTGEAEVAARVARLGPEDRARLLAAYVGDRRNRRHRPGRAFERAVYTFDVVADYGAFRDLQRHRMCTIVWQPLSPGLGYDLPADVAEAGLAEPFQAAMAALAGLYAALAPRFPAQAPYAVGLAHRVRFAMTMNARELMHLAELRSTPQGHPAYRWVAQRMHQLVAAEAGHRGLAEAMRFVVHDEPGAEVGLGRLAAERRLAARGNNSANSA